MNKLLLNLLAGYRYALSPILGKHCRFEPSCSAYAHEAVQKYGACRGTRLALKRLARCHPWCAGGYDPIP
ncbi:MAG TPA: membrane protein insertion efficiency factor YidD [Burkholderiales bacterium]|nr:membrane protein insertion efficiency factor YidD [Burkholderiales bacterium]